MATEQLRTPTHSSFRAAEIDSSDVRYFQKITKEPANYSFSDAISLLENKGIHVSYLFISGLIHRYGLLPFRAHLSPATRHPAYYLLAEDVDTIIAICAMRKKGQSWKEIISSMPSYLDSVPQSHKRLKQRIVENPYLSLVQGACKLLLCYFSRPTIKKRTEVLDALITQAGLSHEEAAFLRAKFSPETFRKAEISELEKNAQAKIGELILRSLLEMK